ncbi:MAG: hypothetical protein ABIR60_07930 [Allosphingosinicella sp.]
MVKAAKGEWWLSGFVPYDPDAPEAIAMPVFRNEQTGEAFSQICYDDRFNTIELYRLEVPMDLITPVSEPHPIDPFHERVIVYTRAGLSVFAGYLSKFKELVNRLIDNETPASVLLQVYELIGEEDKARIVEERLLSEENLPNTAQASLFRSSSRSSFYDIASNHLKEVPDKIPELRWIIQASSHVRNWSLNDLPSHMLLELLSKLNISEVDLNAYLARRKPHSITDPQLSLDIDVSEHATAQKVLNELRDLTRQELRLARVLRRLHETPYIQEELFQHYRPGNKFERIGKETIYREIERDGGSVSGSALFFIINSLFRQVYPKQKGVLLKDLARELNELPEANHVIRTLLERSNLWSVEIWSAVIRAYLNGQNPAPHEEWRIRANYLEERRQSLSIEKAR